METAVSDFDDGKVYLCLDDRIIFATAGHYLIYDSEYLCSIATALIEVPSIDYRQILKSFGDPTVFEVNLPWSLIPISQQLELSMAICEARKDNE